MLGECGLYCSSPMTAIIGDEQLFIKPTNGDRSFVDSVKEVAPYPHTKPYLLIDPDRWEDRA